MPSSEHETIVDLFRDSPELGPRLLDLVFGAPLPAHVTITVGEATLDQMAPIEFSADLMIELKDSGGRVALAIVLEAQLGEDPVKKYSWPVYATVSRAKKRCPACVLVVTPDAKIARLASRCARRWRL